MDQPDIPIGQCDSDTGRHRFTLVRGDLDVNSCVQISACVTGVRVGRNWQFWVEQFELNPQRIIHSPNVTLVMMDGTTTYG